MRRTFILFMLMMVCAGMFAQSVTLSFTGRGSGGIQTEEIYQKIDSLQVRNITRHWEQMIYYPDTVVVMEALAVPMLSVNNSGLSQNVPNPFDCVTEADLTLSEGDAVLLKVVDGNGREYVSYNGKLPAGTHKFEITLAVPQTYFLTAVTSTGKYSVKMVNLGSCGTNRLTLKSSSDFDLSTKEIIANEFSLGDEMEYYAYTTYNNIVFNGSRFQAQNGSEDITIHFNIPYCVRSINVDYRSGCESYTWINGVTYTESDHSLRTRMNLVSAGGCDSIVALDVTIEHPISVDEYITACQPITWNGQYCSASGTYYADLQSQSGCDSTAVLHLNRADNIINHIYETDCESVSWNGELYTETGEYQQTFPSQYGCDSIVILHFTNLTSDVVDSIHGCDEYRWINGRMYYADNNTDTVHLVNQYGCDSIVRLNLTMGHSHPNTIFRTACMEYEFHGEVYRESGTYSQLLTTVSGCDSLVTLGLTITTQVEEDIYESGCESFTYNGQTFTASGIYDVHFTTPVNCDSIVHLHLDIYRNTYNDVYVTECDSYTWFGEEYTTSGTYTHNAVNSHGCDSVITLHLTINHSVANTKTIDACREYMLGTDVITETGDYERTYTAANGCDSVVTYHINIYDNVTHEFTQYACGTYTWAGDTYSQSGDYEKTFPSFVGCDSTVTMHLMLGTPNFGIEDEQSACDSYEWEGTTYFASGDYTKTLTNMYGCDSVVTLHLAVNPTYTMTDSHTACDSYEWEGEVYTESGTYVKNLQSVAGCDSIVTLNLTIKYSVENELWDTAYGPYDISEGSIYDVFRTTYLDSRYDTLGPKIWNNEMYTQSGDYRQTFPAANGCDSIVTLHLVYHERVYDMRDSTTYCTMEYGDQVWMTENLRYMPQVDNTTSDSDPKYYVYGYTGSSLNVALNNSNYNTYGVLYNKVAAGVACPSGWHLPTREEWEELKTYLSQHEEYSCGGVSTNVAKSMASQTLWNTSTGNCYVGNDLGQNNASGFSGLPGGYITGRTSSSMGNEVNWWTSSPASSGYYRYTLSYNKAVLSISYKSASFGFSVRCVKDSE